MKKQVKKDQIISKAIPIFVEFGYSKTTMRVISSRLNINLATISYYFESKENLYTSCAETSMYTLLRFMNVKLLEPTQKVKSKNEAQEVITSSILEFVMKNLSDLEFRNSSNLVNKSLLDSSTTREVIVKNYLTPVYTSFSYLLKMISSNEKSERELFLQINSLIGLATIYIRDYPFIFSETASPTIGQEDHQLIEKIISNHLKVLVSTISSDL
ncbi:TetR family transcriptional regulator [bacterium]|nr:TetR family transcriptional regulator [bacterium]